MPADFVSELNSLDFSKYIGGPMQAAVDAQNAAALAQVDFIKNVGLGDNDIVRTVNFTYSSQSGNETQTTTLSVPLLTMLSVPALRIDEMTIDFNCKLNSVETKDTSESIGVSGSLSLNVWKVKLNVSASYQQTTNKSENIERTYSMAIHVRIVNDEIPAGLDRVLNMLESAITAVTPTDDITTP